MAAIMEAQLSIYLKNFLIPVNKVPKLFPDFIETPFVLQYTIPIKSNSLY